MYICTSARCRALSATYTQNCVDCGRAGTLIPHMEPILLEARRHTQEDSKVEGNPSGIIEFDAMLPEGFLKGWMYLFAAMQGTGKTSLLLMIAANLARQGKKVVFFSGEMSPSQIYYLAGRYQLAVEQIVFHYENDLAKIRDAVRVNVADFLIVDSLQTIHGDTVRRTTWNEQANNSLSLKQLARKSGVTVLAISQVNHDGSIAGPNAVLHNVDVIFKLTAGVSSEVIVKIEKSRQTRGSVDRFVFRKTAHGPQAISDRETCDVSRHGKIMYRKCFAATPVRHDGDITVDELTGVKTEDFLVQGLDSKSTSFLAGVLSSLYPGIQLGYTIMGNRCHKLEADNLLALAMCILSSHFGFDMPVDVAFFGSIDHQGHIITAREMPARTGRAIAQTYRAVFGPIPIGTEEPSWIPCVDLGDVLKKLSLFLRRD